MNNPKVSVICLCYNHQDFVQSSIQSVLNQSYSNVELIVVDDASNDASVLKIESIIKEYPEIKFLALKENIGNCQAFNHGLDVATGEYIIDLAADDLLLHVRVALGVEMLMTKGKTYGVHFCDAEFIDRHGNTLGTHFKRDTSGKLKPNVPEGDVYCDLLERYIVSTPTMMIRKEVFDSLGGYDPNLAYEDFDFWVRSSRSYKYCFSDEVLIKKRDLADSLSKRQYGTDSKFLWSTLAVCRKAKVLNESPEENEALKKRISYELRQAILSRHFEVAKEFSILFKELGGNSFFYDLCIRFRLKIPFISNVKVH